MRESCAEVESHLQNLGKERQEVSRLENSLTAPADLGFPVPALAA